MQVAEVDKIYEYNGKQYLACKAEDTSVCNGCDLFATSRVAALCPPMKRDGKNYTCLANAKGYGVIFKEIKK